MTLRTEAPKADFRKLRVPDTHRISTIIHSPALKEFLAAMPLEFCVPWYSTEVQPISIVYFTSRGCFDEANGQHKR